ncbi:MAG TPA: hypothetical protein VLX85_02070 [Stellaceae bacterium]|nr:hypothetical protein [Stellaceae bacterium]
MMSPRFVPLFALLVTLAACGTAVLPPYETIPPPVSRAERKDSGETPPPRVALCYNTFTTSAHALLALAKESCDPGTTPKPLERDFDLNNCPILEPTRATFACNKS